MNLNKEQKYIVKYCETVGDLLNNELVDSMKTYNHHGKINTHFHSVFVSYNVLKMCVALKLDEGELSDIVRASLLHDFYLYDWHITKHEEKHAWYHPKASVKNVNELLFELTPKQRDMILYHMFPLAKPPKSLGGWLLTLADKHCANTEIFGLSGSFKPVYDRISEECKKYG